MATKPAAKKAAKAPPPATKSAPAKKAAAPETVTLKSVFEGLAEEYSLSRKQAHAFLSSMLGSMAEELKKGNKLRMSGLGTLEVKDRPARTGRNPATGESIQIAASKKIAFRPAKELKEGI